MDERLTHEEIVDIQDKYGLHASPGFSSYGLRLLLVRVCVSHEMLRAQLAEAQADVRALATNLRDVCEMNNMSIPTYVLARPGSRRAIAEVSCGSK